MDETGMLPRVLSARSLDDLMNAGLSILIAAGEPVKSRKGQNVELAAVALHLEDPRSRLSRTEARGKPVSALAELLWYASGSADPSVMAHYVSHYGDSVGDATDAYGPRLFGHDSLVRSVAASLAARPSSRRAVVPVVRADDLGEAEMPCTCDLQFLVRADRLHLIAHLRSSDAYRGFIHDVFCFTMIQELVARDLGVDIGSYTHFAGSYHLYDADRDAAQRFLAEGLQWNDPMPPMPVGPQWDNLDALIQYAGHLRQGGEPGDPDHELPEYWRDLGLLLEALELDRIGRRDRIQSLLNRVGSEVMTVYLEDRIEGGRR